MAKTNGVNVLSELDAFAPKKVTWFDKSKPDVQQQLLEIQSAVRAGTCKHSVRTILSWARAKGVRVAEPTLGKWLRGDE